MKKKIDAGQRAVFRLRAKRIRKSFPSAWRSLDIEFMSMKRILYFGCGMDKGHFLWMSEWHSAMNKDALKRATGIESVTDNFFRSLDGTFTPMITAQGAYKVSSVPPFLIVAWHDYTVDTRPGSNSALLAVGYGGSRSVIADAPNWFPSVMRRQTVALYPALNVSVPQSASAC